MKRFVYLLALISSISYGQNPKVIAHRGGAGLAPENTIACFKKGFLYADMVELDIQPTKDQYLLVFHDRNGIERTTSGRGKVPDLTYDYLRSLDAGSWFSSKYKNEINVVLLQPIHFW